MDINKVQLTNTGIQELPQEENGRPIDAVEVKAPRVNYCLYARKSTEDDERQALSIDSQIKEMAASAQLQGIYVTEIRKESHSAKNSGQRPVFNKLIDDIREGLFQGIIAWAPDRLSRNAGDLGTLVDLMDSGYLIELRTHGQVFTNSPNDKFLLMILCSQAKLENDNRGINVKRGFRAKCEMGFRPNMTPLGYENDHYSGKGQKKVFIDEKRAPIIKKIFEKVASGDSGRDIFDWLKNDTSFRTRSDKIVPLSMVYRMLNNPYYCGLFEFPKASGKWYKGAYESIITKELFDKVQTKMKVAPKSKPGTKQFNFTKLLQCGACGSGITAQIVTKKFKNGTSRQYTYYHCTQSKNYDCHQQYIREEKMVEDFVSLLNEIPIEKIKNNKLLEQEVGRVQRLSSAVLGINDEDQEQPAIDIRSFGQYIFNQGSKEEKRALVSCIGKTLYLRDSRITAKI